MMPSIDIFSLNAGEQSNAHAIPVAFGTFTVTLSPDLAFMVKDLSVTFTASVYVPADISIVSYFSAAFIADCIVEKLSGTVNVFGLKTLALKLIIIGSLP